MHPVVVSFFICIPCLLLPGLVGATNGTTCEAVETCLANGKICDILPVPKEELRPLLTGDEYTLTELRRGVHAFYDGGAFTQILVDKTTRRLAMVDFPRTLLSEFASNGSSKLVHAVQKLTKGVAIRRVDFVYTHRHFDHIGSAAIVDKYVREKFAKSLKFPPLVWGTKDTKDILKKKKDGREAMPQVNIIVYPVANHGLSTY